MKSDVTPQLVSFLAGRPREFYMADLYTFELIGSDDPVRLCALDMDVTLPSETSLVSWVGHPDDPDLAPSRYLCDGSSVHILPDESGDGSFFYHVMLDGPTFRNGYVTAAFERDADANPAEYCKVKLLLRELDDRPLVNTTIWYEAAMWSYQTRTEVYISDGNSNDLASITTLPPLVGAHELTFSASGNHLAVVIDGTEVLSYDEVRATADGGPYGCVNDAGQVGFSLADTGNDPGILRLTSFVAVAADGTMVLSDGFLGLDTLVDHQATETTGERSFDGHGPLVTRGQLRSAVGLEVSEVELEVTATTADLLLGLPWMHAARLGALDGARVTVERLYMRYPGDVSLGTVKLFIGNASDVQVGRLTCRMSVKDSGELLNVQMPRNVFQTSCRHVLYGPGCSLSKASFAATGTVQAGSDADTLVLTGVNATVGYYALGTVLFTSGANEGVTRSVKSNAVTQTLELALALPVAPAPGDTVVVHPGCDHTSATCSGKFSNLPNFGGEPFVPVPETAL